MNRQLSGFLATICALLIIALSACNNSTQHAEEEDGDNKDDNVTFVWATGGHPSTAGHGNFYDESYTAVLERTVRPVFRAIGIHFEGRNYAMGGTESAPASTCRSTARAATDTCSATRRGLQVPEGVWPEVQQLGGVERAPAVARSAARTGTSGVTLTRFEY